MYLAVSVASLEPMGFSLLAFNISHPEGLSIEVAAIMASGSYHPKFTSRFLVIMVVPRDFRKRRRRAPCRHS